MKYLRIALLALCTLVPGTMLAQITGPSPLGPEGEGGEPSPGIVSPVHASDSAEIGISSISPNPCALSTIITFALPVEGNALLVLNEPEAGLHPDVIPALADLIANAATRGQVVVTTHLAPLAEAITARTRSEPLRLCLHQGQTELADDILPGGGRRIRLG